VSSVYPPSHRLSLPYGHVVGTGVKGLMRGLATLTRCTKSLQLSETGMEDPQEDPLAVHCFCVCSGSALLGDLLGVSRSVEYDLLSVLSYSVFFFSIYYTMWCFISDVLLCYIL